MKDSVLTVVMISVFIVIVLAMFIGIYGKNIYRRYCKRNSGRSVADQVSMVVVEDGNDDGFYKKISDDQKMTMVEREAMKDTKKLVKDKISEAFKDGGDYM